jgi:hypothetical protein
LVFTRAQKNTNNHTQTKQSKARLTGGAWSRLLPDDHPGLAEVKWCANRFDPYLVIDPVRDGDPGSRDAEEVSIEVRACVSLHCCIV